MNMHRGAVLNFFVRNQQTDVTTGWAARAYSKGLKVRSACGRFGNEIHLVKDLAGNFVKLEQNIHCARKLDATGFSDAQLEIVKTLQDCGLVQ